MRYGPVISSPTNFFLLLQQITFSNEIRPHAQKDARSKRSFLSFFYLSHMGRGPEGPSYVLENDHNDIYNNVMRGSNLLETEGHDVM